MAETDDGVPYFRELAEHSNAVLWMFTADWSQLLFVNSAYEAIFGRPADQLYEEPADFLEAVHPADRRRVQNGMAALSDGASVDLEYRVNEAEDFGRQVWVQAEPIRDGAGEVVRVAGVVRDVTERRARERDLRRQADRFEAIFETVPEPLVHVGFDADGGPLVKQVNGAFTEIFGYEPEEIVGEPLNEFIVPEGELDEARQLDEAARVEGSAEREVQRQAVDGLRDFLFRVNQFWLEGGEQESIAIYTDVTEQKHRERELRRQNDRLDEFASVVSHDLRNPLNVIQGRAQLARTDGDEVHFEAIERATTRMEGLIDDLLALARAGATVDELKPVDLASAIEAAWRTVDTGDATVRTEVDRAVLADESRLRQLLENLFRNAIEHAGDDVTVMVGPTADGFFIEDDGPGIPPEDRERVFESGVTTTADGTGFGLRIVRTIADAHGWDIEVEGGARFEVTGVQFA